MQSSLRTRKSQGPRKAQRSGTKMAKTPGGAVPRDRKSRVDDKIKKRMSMRYAEISGPTPVGGIPAVPSLPAGIGAPSAYREQDELVREPRDKAAEEKQAKEDDRKILDDDNFDADAYLKSKLANSTEAEIKSLQSSLRRAQGDMAVELQRNVFNNYAEFVQISKEISTLENEMLELKESLSEYKSMPSLLHIPDPSTNGSTMSTFRRSSVADLRIMYFNQMQTLHAQIEGSAKFAPTTPGRHVVNEMDGVAALNAATYKVVGKVKFVILDDLVLVARRRRRTAAAETRGGSISEGKLVAERCWPLNEMLVLDTKDSPTMTNVFKIRHGKETHVYRTNTPADKKALLSLFRQVAEELADKRRKEREGEHERRKSMWNGADRSSMAFNADRLPPMNDWMADLARNAGVNVGSSASDKSERDGRWVGEWADELTVAIALREWEKAVTLVEQGKAKSSIMPSLATKLPILSSQLTSALLQSLSMPSNRKSTVISLISWLLRLEAGPAARSTFLNMRTQVLRSLVRKIPFEGHVGAYVGDLAVVTFTAIKHTADWFLASFKDNEAASAFIEWARTQIESYAEMFRKQVYSPDVERKVVDECMTITYSQSRKLLQEYGLDFRFLFNDLLLEHPRELDSSKPLPAHFAFHARHAKGSEASHTPSSIPSTRSPATSAAPLPDDVPDVPALPPTSRSRSGSVAAPRPLPAVSGLSISSSNAPSPPISTSSRRTPVSSAGSSTPGAYRPTTPGSSRNGTVPATPPRDRRGMRTPAPPPPRSTQRPASSAHRAVAQHEGMI